MTQNNSAEALLGTRSTTPYGVLVGLEFPLPASGLTVTFKGGILRLAPDRDATIGSLVGREFKVAGSTKAFTASKDTYVYAKNDGTLGYSEQTLGAAKPTLASLDADLGQYLYKVVSDGSNVTSVTDLRQFVPAFIETIAIGQVSFVTATQGATVKHPIPFRGRLLRLSGVVAAALGANDTGTATAARVSMGTATDIAGAVITGAISAAVAVEYDAVPTLATNPDFRPGDFLRITTLKTTTGGAMNLVAAFERYL